MSEFINIVIPPLQQEFSYLTPSGTSAESLQYCRVWVPLGKRSTQGFALGNSGSSVEPGIDPSRMKEVLTDRGWFPCFTAELEEFFRWVSRYYACPLSTVIDTAVPEAVSPKIQRSVCLQQIDDLKLRGPLQNDLTDYLSKQAGQRADYSQLTKRFRGAAASLKRLLELGVVRYEDHQILAGAPTIDQAAWAKTQVELSSEQDQSLSQICGAIANRDFHSFLLHGATGSGKTEVYIEAAQQTLAAGQGALIIVPEIALTPQLIDRFAARLDANIAVLHSGIRKRQRWESWQALLEGRCRIAIGARSAVFAPVPNLGLIVVDEEHDSSYKQSEGLRYNARDLAVARGKLSSCPVVLGSATPSLESYNNAAEKKYRYLLLPSRHVSGAGISVSIVDLNRKKSRDLASKHVSSELYEALTKVLERKEQAFILYNRRGFASFLQCDKCGSVIYCPNCSVTFTYHRKQHSLRCHYCNLQIVPPELCNACSGTADEDSESEGPGSFIQCGAGTEKVYEELQQLFPTAAIDRLDRDAVADNQSYRSILDRIRAGETSIVVGTQMLAKGHDLPGVTLVGVVDCDVGLHMPDFRAGERVYQLLTQASGRAGRGSEPGLVILQTRVPNHSSLVKTVEQDYRGFAVAELRNRRALQYPPYGRLLRVLACCADQQQPPQVLTEMQKIIFSLIESKGLPCSVLGPAPATLSKLKTEYRWHLLVKSNRAAALRKVIEVLRRYKLPSKKLRLIFDLDPQDLL